MKREQALSEVIGFLMIVALLGILFSMYLIYVVPIQGRDAEISHMKYITQEFIGLKADIDGLIINNKINLPIARSFELGTLSSVGSGSLSIMPMSSYIEASGTLMVNEQNDFLKVSINGDMADLGSGLRPLLTEFKCNEYDKCPPVPINFTIEDRFFNLTTKNQTFLNNTSITINLTDIYYTYPNGTQILPGDNPYNKINGTARINATNPIVSHDLVLEMWDNRTYPDRSWIAERALIENITLNKTYGTNITYDFLSDNDFIPNNSSVYYLTHASQYIPPDSFKNKSITTQVESYPPRIGSLKYESANRYWVNQDLTYEMGGLFLQQGDQGSSIMLVPSIAVTPVKNVSDSSEYDLKVSVNNIRITDTEDISGSVSAQIFTKVDQINQNLFNGSTEITSHGIKPAIENVSNFKMREAELPNAHAIWLQFTPDEEIDDAQKIQSTELWKRGFDQIKTITNKTVSDNPDIGEYSGWIYSFRIEDDSVHHYSANMIIGEMAKTDLYGSCLPKTTNENTCFPIAKDYIENRSSDDEAFILDYSESEVSLVMQSGAL